MREGQKLRDSKFQLGFHPSVVQVGFLDIKQKHQEESAQQIIQYWWIEEIS